MNNVIETFSKEIDAVTNKIIDVYKTGNKVLVCGNGGSASDCEHIVGELQKSFKKKRPIDKVLFDKLCDSGHDDIANSLQDGICAISLSSHTSIITAIANDIGYEMVFAQQLFACAKKGDVLLAFSTSGNSKAVYNAAILAKQLGVFVVAFTGKSGGKLISASDICFNVNEVETYKIQELHLPLYHDICAKVEDKIW